MGIIFQRASTLPICYYLFNNTNVALGEGYGNVIYNFLGQPALGLEKLEQFLLNFLLSLLFL